MEDEIQKPKKHRARRAKAIVNPAASLLAALKFVSMAQKKNSSEHRHCLIENHWAVASNGAVTIGTPIEEDLQAFPCTFQFAEVLSKVKDDFSITQISEEVLSVSSGAFRGLVECAEDVSFASQPLPSVCTIDDRVKQAIASVVMLTEEDEEGSYKSAVFLKSGSAFATNGISLIEFWHGFDLPTMKLPRQAALCITKTDKTLNGFGFGGDCATFYFEDGSFVHTKLYAPELPMYEGLFALPDLNPWPVPAEFYDAVHTVASLCKKGAVFFKNMTMASDEVPSLASTFKIEGLPEDLTFSVEELRKVEHVFKNVHFDEVGCRAVFFAENARGLTIGGRIEKEAEGFLSKSKLTDC